MPGEDQGLEFDQDLEQDDAIAPPTAKATSAPKRPGPRGSSPQGGKAKSRPAPRLGKGRGRRKAAPRHERPKVTVQVVGLDRSFAVEEGTDLLTACKDNHVNVFWGPWAQAFNCRGVASCALCKVQVVEGRDNLSPRTKKEDKRLRGKPDDWRLACHATLQGDVRIDPFPRIPIDQQVGEEAIRRALMTEDERESLRREAQAARQAERETRKEAQPDKQKQGLLARLKDKAAKKEKDGTATKGNGKDKRRKKGRSKPDKADKGADEGEGQTDGSASKKDTGGRKSFGLKGRKS